MPKDSALLEWLKADRGGAAPLHQQLDEQLGDAIRDGRLPSGTPLPSSRRLAAELAISRGTILAAYDRLLGEGLLEVRGRSATFVADALPGRSEAPERKAPADGRASTAGFARANAAFEPNMPAIDAFPAMRWARLLTARCRQMTVELAVNHVHAGGYRPLRAALAEHLRTSRGVLCEPEQVIITNTARAALATVCRLAGKAGERCLVEDPGYTIGRRLIQSFGFEIVPLPVDERGIRLDPPLPKARLAYITPTHQMPLGVRLAEDRCETLIAWAKSEEAWIIEDDYDSEFRYTGQPIVALQHWDPDGSVIHIGTFAKTLFPSLRVAYLVVPKRLAQQTSDSAFLSGNEPMLHIQAALSDFIAQGHYAAYIRKARVVYRRRQSLLVEALNRHLAGITTVPQPAGGMYVVLPLPSDIPAPAVQSAAAEQGLRMLSIAHYAVNSPAPNALQLGYGGLPDRQIEPAARRLAAVIRAFRTGPAKLS
jgi:GntR family transcriptional regulator/MocR family aminotransferase